MASGAMSDGSLARFTEYVRSMNVDYYIPHPRETQPLNIGGQLIGDAKKIAEETIMELAGQAKPVIYAWFSTVLFNINPSAARKVYISIGDAAGESERIQLCKRVGAEIVTL